MADKYKLIILAVICILVMGLFLGSGLTADNYQYFLSIRTPKVLAMILAAIAVAQSSFVFQTITNNRILTPGIMGFDSLYLLIQVLVVIIGAGSHYILSPYINFSMSVLLMMGFSMMLFHFYFGRKPKNILMLLLIGVVFGQVFDSSMSFFTMIMDPNSFAFFQSNMFASFNNVDANLVYMTFIPLLVLCWLLYRMSYSLDIFWLDKDNATSLGVDVHKITRHVLLITAFMIAISTALIGPVLFFGLLVSNLTREVLQSYQHRLLLIGCSLISVAVLLLGQWSVEHLFMFETTIGTIINFVGGIYFLSVLLRNKGY
ncbi:ABC transporter permease [Vibrio albus]|uniref:ABC transporter permease n=1 Tax=Vibrio albus TaxID=2200953 RepID=A0A2U3BD97_9VIBR|nr:iron chelate uptake ABC transporter family permease subunit [Vibrio albus]PWI34750.1 ABC transporter permease [Vibrio albus]